MKRTRTVEGPTGPIAITIEMSEDDWTSDQIKALRKARSQSQTEFGLALLDATPGHAQNRMSRLERGKAEPTAAECRTLQRMDEGEI